MISARGRYIILFLFIAMNAALPNILTPKEQLWASALLLSTSVILCLMRPLFGFAVIVAELLGLGFFATGKAFIELWSQQYQIEVIIKLLFFMVTMGITWLMVLQIKRLWQNIQNGERLIAELKKYEDNNNVLTLNEFLYRAETIFVAMRRRGEVGFLIKLTLDPQGKSFALRILNEHLSQAALQSVRNQYDLVGKISDQELIMMLQNTNKEGAAIVIERLRRKINERIQIPSDMYTLAINQLPDTWDEARMKIGGATFPKRRDRKRQVVHSV